VFSEAGEPVGKQDKTCDVDLMTGEGKSVYQTDPYAEAYAQPQAPADSSFEGKPQEDYFPTITPLTQAELAELYQ